MFTDRLVVTVTYTNFHVEVQPVFEEMDDDGGSYFKYPDTYNGGSWKITKPRQEMQAVKDLNEEKNRNLRLLCKMARAWKNKHGVGMGGLLIDTLAYNFMKSTTYYDDKSYLYFDWLSRDFFKFLSEEPDKSHYQAPGSNQDVKVRRKFQRKAKEAYDLCLKAIEAEKDDSINDKWKKVYGRGFPSATVAQEAVEKSSMSWQDTEEFVEDLHQIDIRYYISLDCDVSQNGFRENTLAYMLMRRIPLLANKKLLFRVAESNIPEPYTLKWKVRNRGVEAERRDCIRGQIVADEGSRRKKESTSFQGEHFVECYAVKDGVVVARASLDVPIH